MPFQNYANGKVEKSLTSVDQIRLEEAIEYASQVLEGAGVSLPFISGMYNGGHLGGTAPLKKEYVKDLKPSWLPEGLWVADLSLTPRSQRIPTILLTAALSLKVARKIIAEKNGFLKINGLKRPDEEYKIYSSNPFDLFHLCL